MKVIDYVSGLLKENTESEKRREAIWISDKEELKDEILKNSAIDAGIDLSSLLKEKFSLFENYIGKIIDEKIETQKNTVESVIEKK